MKHALIAAALVGGLASQSFAQGSYVNTITNGNIKYYSFTPSTSGQFIATTYWVKSSVTLLMVLVCGSSNPQTYGVGAGKLDRISRLEAGILGANPCLLGLSTTDGATTDFMVNLQKSTDQLATVQTAAVSSSVQSTTNEGDTRLREHAEQVFTELKARMR